MEILDKENAVRTSDNSTGRDTVLTVEEVAERLKVSPATVYGLLRGGELVSFRVGRAWRVDEADLFTYIQQLKIRNGNGKTKHSAED